MFQVPTNAKPIKRLQRMFVGIRQIHNLYICEYSTLLVPKYQTNSKHRCAVFFFFFLDNKSWTFSCLQQHMSTLLLARFDFLHRQQNNLILSSIQVLVVIQAKIHRLNICSYLKLTVDLQMVLGNGDLWNSSSLHPLHLCLTFHILHLDYRAQHLHRSVG